MTGALSLIFFVSGASALVFETLWFHQAGLAFGNSVWASSLVLAGFMAGLAAGNAFAGRRGARVRDPLRAYAYCELAIAVVGVAMVFGLPRLGPAISGALAPLVDAPWLRNSLRFVLAFALLLLPSAAMGATLPLLTEVLAPAEEGFGRLLGRLYGWNTLGAVAGALAAEAFAIGALGIRGTALAAGASNLAAAAAVLALGARRPPRPVRAPPPLAAASSRSGGGLLAAAFLSGFVLLALEVVWFRLLTLFVMEYALSFALMLAVVLAGIALGGFAASLWLRLAPGAHRHAATVAWLAGITCIASYALSPRYLGLRGVPLIEDPRGVVGLAVPLMLPTAFLSGVLFTQLGAALRRKLPSEAGASGALSFANTIGAAAGALAGGFVLLPALGVERSLFALALGYVVAGLAAFAVAPRRLALVTGAGALAATALFPFGLMTGRHLPTAIERWTRGGAYRPVFVREGLTQTVVYLERLAFDARHLSHLLVTNGYSMSGTGSRNRRYMQLFVYLPVALRPEPRSALLISYGVGATARALVQTRSLERIDVVDISREILDASAVVHDPTANPLRDPRVVVHVEDGRYFLQTTAQRFDLVTGEPPPPPLAGVANLYTREYFALMRDRLTEGGVASYWLPLHSLSEASAKSILRAFCDVFDDCSLWHGNHLDLVMVGSRGLDGVRPAEAFTQQWRAPDVAAEMRAVGVERPEQIGALFVADAEQLRAWTHDALPVVDDHPRRILAKTAHPGRTSPEYAAWFDATAARERFARSAFVARLWPAELREASLRYFAFQRAIDQDAFAPLSLDRDIDALHAAITGTDLRAPVLWLLDSDADAQRAAGETEGSAREHPDVLAHLAAGALAERRFDRAAELLARAEERSQGTRRRDLFRLRIYALCLAGRGEEAARLAEGRYGDRTLASLPPFWRWLRATFGIDPSRATAAVRPQDTQE